MANKYVKSFNFGGDTLYPLPIVTTEQNGQVLKVVDGVWSLADLVRAGSDTLYWDGNTEGLESFDFMSNGEICYHVSDIHVPMDQIIGSTVDYIVEGTVVHDAVIEDVYDVSMEMDIPGLEIYMVATLFVMIVSISQDLEVEGLTLRKGLYFANYDEPLMCRVTSLTVPGFGGF